MWFFLQKNIYNQEVLITNILENNMKKNRSVKTFSSVLV